MKLTLIPVFVFALSGLGLAAGPTREVVHCQDDHYTLVIRETAVPTYRNGTLSFSGRSIKLKCGVELQEQDQTSGVNMTCLEDRAGEGLYLAEVTLIDLKGTAELAHQQMYPLKPKFLSTLPCNVTEE
jgi:hypothetical protein